MLFFFKHGKIDQTLVDFPTKSSKNIARGTTDPEMESINLRNLLNNSIS